MKSSLTIVVNTCDSYSDVLSLFFSAFREYWPDVPFDVVINSETNKYPEYPFATACVQKDKIHWGARLINVLNSIQTEYVLMLYDDFVLERRVSSAEIQEALKLISEINNGAVVYLTQTNLPTRSGNISDKFEIVLDSVDYRINSAPAIWKKEALVAYTRVTDNPWVWEVFGSYRSFNNNDIFLTPREDVKDLYPYNYRKGGAIYRGKWVQEVVLNKIEKYNLPIDVHERGVTNFDERVSRSLKWKIEFILSGFRTIGVRMFIFIYRIVKQKAGFGKS